ncbi:unnamed protein product [Mycena citricolor]|uniref:endo-polygalacturonase n=1 Tax=Mycena citricolor TaxID=2018698 RepID=A0AAD2HRP6_9AGAR|nr:unnamed protein product [Mycena citricolor]
MLLSVANIFYLVTVGAVAATSPAASRTATAKRATCTVNSVSSASNLSTCTNVVIEPFTVPSGGIVTIAVAPGASITMTGDITFAKTNGACTPTRAWHGRAHFFLASGPLLIFQTDGVLFNGGNHKFNGNGALYWDGLGTGGGVPKPHPLIRFKGWGTFQNVTVFNAPAHAISIKTTNTTLVQFITVDDAAGATLGHNTDAFDVGASDLTISKCTVVNQDDCVAVNSGSNVLVEDNSCTGSHGISIGSISSNNHVSNFKAARNIIQNGSYGLRIKVDANATNASVSNVIYESNTVSGIKDFGVLITQSYPVEDGTPGPGGPISNVSFVGGTTNVGVTSKGFSVVVDCAACLGTWDFSGLNVTVPGLGSKIAADQAKIIGGHF